ncbi:MAG TPA: D-aminoacyl-tRNA deacylase [Candidatus Limnocylindrales bacterium]|nr:D-aminoacyl-tRNA deacylase [Candidatus Limnocylindrales bacterium]
MRGLVQRVHGAAVRVGGDVVGQIGAGLCVFVGVGHDDGEADAQTLAERVVNLRVFPDDAGKMNRSLLDTGGSLLAVSQFTLMGDTRRGRRPSFVAAAAPEHANPLFERFASEAASLGVGVATGRFGAHMDIDIHADGPVTLMLDTKESRRG